MRVFRKKVGDIYLNPLWGDFWLLKKIYDREKQKDIWVLELLDDDYYEELANVKDFKKIGNIYDMIKEKIESE